MPCVIRLCARLVRQSRRRLAPLLRVCIPVSGVRVLTGAPMPGYDTHTRTLRLGGLDYRIRSLADLQQFADPDNHAQLLGISSAQWSLFGHVWPAGRLLAEALAPPEIGKAHGRQSVCQSV